MAVTRHGSDVGGDTGSVRRSSPEAGVGREAPVRRQTARQRLQQADTTCRQHLGHADRPHRTPTHADHRRRAYFSPNSSKAVNVHSDSVGVNGRAFQFAIRIDSIRFAMRIDSNRFVL